MDELLALQGVLEEMRDGNVMRSVRFDSELPNVVCEIPFFVGISQPRTFQARKTSDVTILALSKFDYEEVMKIYPEQNDIIVSNVLACFQLDKDGNDASMARQTDPELKSLAEDSKEKLRSVLDPTRPDSCQGPSFHGASGPHL